MWPYLFSGWNLKNLENNVQDNRPFPGAGIGFAAVKYDTLESLSESKSSFENEMKQGQDHQSVPADMYCQ